MSAAAIIDPGIAVIDADTHLTEPYDLWTARAPQRLRDRVPQVRQVIGQPMWTVDGVAMQRASASSVGQRRGLGCRREAPAAD